MDSNSPASDARIRGGIRRRLVHAATALVILSMAGTGLVAAAIPLDFGTVSVGGVKSLSTTVPLEASLSDVPPETILYSGGNQAIDLALSLAGLSVPLSAGALYAATGEVTATYHLSGGLTIGTDFSLDAPGCATGSGSCSATVTFSPTDVGLRTDTLHWSSSDVVITGGGTLGQLVQLMAGLLAGFFEDQLTIDLSGIGVPSTGTVAAQVSIAASAACIELSTAAIDFGNLSLGAEDAPANPIITITNCSGAGETLFASGTDATGTSSQWSLVDSSATCADTLGLDNYRMLLASPTLPAPVSLSVSNKTVQALASAESVDHTARIYTACPGSTGAGRVMTMFINYLVTGE